MDRIEVLFNKVLRMENQITQLKDRIEKLENNHNESPHDFVMGGQGTMETI